MVIKEEIVKLYFLYRIILLSKFYFQLDKARFKTETTKVKWNANISGNLGSGREFIENFSWAPFIIM